MQVRVDTEEDRSGLFRETRTVHPRLVHSCQRCYHIRLLVQLGARLFTRVNEGAVAEASKATCIAYYIVSENTALAQSTSLVMQCNL